MITPEKKDIILNMLCDLNTFEKHGTLEIQPFLDESGLLFSELQAILSQFERLRLVSDINIRNSASKFYITIHLEILDFRNNGGFTVQEQLLKLTLEKLSLEVEELRNEYPDRTEKFTTIAANIATCLSFLIATK